MRVNDVCGKGLRRDFNLSWFTVSISRIPVKFVVDVHKLRTIPRYLQYNLKSLLRERTYFSEEISRKNESEGGKDFLMPSLAQVIHDDSRPLTTRFRFGIACLTAVVVLAGFANTPARGQITVDGKTTGQTIRGYANRAAYTGRSSARDAKQISSKPITKYSATFVSDINPSNTQRAVAHPAVYIVDNTVVDTSSALPASSVSQSGATFVADRYSQQRRPAHHNNYSSRRGYSSRNYNYGGYRYGYQPYYSRRSYGYGYSNYGGHYSPYSSHYRYRSYRGHSYYYGGSHYSGYGGYYGGYGHSHGYSGYSGYLRGYSRGYHTCR